MLGSKIKRLAELEQQVAASFRQATDKRLQAIWAQYSDAEHGALLASLERRAQPGYTLTAEDEAVERRWYEAVQAVVPAPQQTAIRWQEWALAWCEVIRKHG